ncbi:MAG: hypothetical protein WBB28_07235 [Crinalium sp.]
MPNPKIIGVFNQAGSVAKTRLSQDLRYHLSEHENASEERAPLAVYAPNHPVLTKLAKELKSC